MSTRRAFTREFKVEAVALVPRQGLSVAEAARRLEIGQNLLRKWREQLAAEGSRAFAAKSQPSALEEENRRLRAAENPPAAYPRACGLILRKLVPCQTISPTLNPAHVILGQVQAAWFRRNGVTDSKNEDSGCRPISQFVC